MFAELVIANHLFEGIRETHQADALPGRKVSHTRCLIIQIVHHTLLQLDRSREEEIGLLEETNAEEAFTVLGNTIVTAIKNTKL